MKRRIVRRFGEHRLQTRVQWHRGVSVRRILERGSSAITNGNGKDHCVWCKASTQSPAPDLGRLAYAWTVRTNSLISGLSAGMRVYAAGLTGESALLREQLLLHPWMAAGVDFTSVQLPGVDLTNYLAIHSQST